MGIILGLVILALTVTPQVSVCPSSTAKLMSFQFDQVNGYGVQARLDRFSLGYYNLTLSTHSPGTILDAGSRWVYQRKLELWEINTIAYKSEVMDIGLGLNRLEGGSIGWQVFMEKSFDDIVIARVGFRRVEECRKIDSIYATFAVDIFRAIKMGRNDYIETDIWGSNS